MNKKYKENFIRAGQIAKEVRTFGKSLIIPGASYNQIISAVTKKIYELGAIPAFPPQIALNDVAAHYLPHPSVDIELKDQMVKLDVGICVNGAIGDTATTVDLSGKNEKIVLAAEAALQAAITSLKVGMKVSEIGAIINATIESYGLKAVQNLAGHGLGIYKVQFIRCT
jgi:methionyl aminopeptidase